MGNQTYIGVLKEEIRDLAFNFFMVKYYIREMKVKVDTFDSQLTEGLEKELSLLEEQRDDLETLINTITKILQSEKGKK